MKINSQGESPLVSVWVHSLTLSYTLESMKCDSQPSFLVCTFASPCLGCKPKAKVVINTTMDIAWFLYKLILMQFILVSDKVCTLSTMPSKFG